MLAVAAALPGCTENPSAPSIPPAVAAAGEAITAETFGRAVEALAHDSTRGRGTPSPELDEAGRWIADQFAVMGLNPAGTDGYLQPFDYSQRSVDSAAATLELAGQPTELSYGSDFALFAAIRDDTTGPLVWAGPVDDPFPAPGLELDGAVVLFDHPDTLMDGAWFEKILQADGRASERGRAGIAVVLPAGVPSSALAGRVDLLSQTLRWTPIVVLTESAADSLVALAGTSLDTLRAGFPRIVADNFRVRGDLKVTTHRPANVAAVLEGSDPTLREHYIVVSAHYDHMGVGFADARRDSIYNGADDNASGTAALLEVARALASLDARPRRSVLFLATTAEEKGLLGSRHFMSAPTVPASRLDADINLDMIARNGGGWVEGIGMLYTTLGEDARDILESLPDLGISMTHVGGGLYRGASDHAPFVDRGIPSLFLHTGLHGDYHEPSDEVEVLDLDKGARVARLTFHLVHRAADDTAAVDWTALGRAEVPTAR